MTDPTRTEDETDAVIFADADYWFQVKRIGWERAGLSREQVLASLGRWVEGELGEIAIREVSNREADR